MSIPVSTGVRICATYCTLSEIETADDDPPEGVNFELIDLDTEETVLLTTSDIEYGNQNGFRWAFKTPETGNFGLFLFSDMNKNQGVKLSYHQVRLNRLVIP